MTSNLHFSFLLVSLFIFSHLSYSYADDALIQSVCTNANDKPFCLQLFRSDSSSASADLNGLCRISLNHIFEQSTSTRGKIPGLMKQARDHLMMSRLQYCLQNYNDGSSKFLEAITSANNKAYRDVLTKIGQGFYNVTACEGIFTRGSPVQVSPFTADTNLMVKLIQLPALVIKRIGYSMFYF